MCKGQACIHIIENKKAVNGRMPGVHIMNCHSKAKPSEVLNRKNENENENKFMFFNSNEFGELFIKRSEYEYFFFGLGWNACTINVDRHQ